MLEAMNYSESRKTQENKDFIKKIDDSLVDDGKVDNREAKEINDKYKLLKSNIVAITRSELGDLAKGLGLGEGSSLFITLKKIEEVTNQVDQNIDVDTKPATVETTVINEPVVVKESDTIEYKTEKTIKSELISKYYTEYKGLQSDIIKFINLSFTNSLKGGLGGFNVSNFDKKDNIEGFSKSELEQFSQILDKAMNQMNLLGGYNEFKEQNMEDNIYHDMDYFVGTKDVYVANKVEDFQDYCLGEKDIKISDYFHNYSEEELSNMRDEKFDITNSNNMKNFLVLLGLELGDGVQDILKFLLNVPMGLLLSPRYTSNRISLSDGNVDTKIEVQLQIEQDQLLKENPSLVLGELLGEKGIQLIKQLGEMMVSGKNGDIALLLVTIAGLLAGGAGAIKLGARFARKQAVMSARKAGKAGRTSAGRSARNRVRDGGNQAGKIQTKLDKIDDIVGGAGIGHMTGAFSGAGSIDNISDVNKIDNKLDFKTSDDLINGVYDYLKINGKIEVPHYKLDRVDDLFKELSDIEIKEKLFGIIKNNSEISMKQLSHFLFTYGNHLGEVVPELDKILKADKFNSRIYLNILLDRKFYNKISTKNILQMLEIDGKNTKEYLELLKNNDINKGFVESHLNIFKEYVSLKTRGIDLSVVISQLNKTNKSIYIRKIISIFKNNPDFDFSKIDFDFRNIDEIELLMKKGEDRLPIEIKNLNAFYRKINLNSLEERLGFSLEKYFNIDGFDPEVEIKNILNSTDRTNALKEYKSNFLKQKHKLSLIISDVENICNKKPNITLEDLLAEALRHSSDFSKKQKIDIIKKIENYYIKVNKIDSLLDEFKGRPNELLEKVYGVKTIGKVEVEKHSSAMVFYISDFDEYKKLYGGKSASSTGGFKTSSSQIEDLHGSITFVKGKKKGKGSFSEKVKIHESRHALNDIIFRNNNNGINRAKDEMIAFLADGSSLSYIKKTLTKKGGLYDYYHNSTLDEGYTKLWNNHVIKVNKAIEAISIIREAFPDNYIDLLSVTDINHWGRIVENQGKLNKLLINLNLKSKELLLFCKENALEISALIVLGELVSMDDSSVLTISDYVNNLGISDESKKSIINFIENHYNGIESIKTSINELLV